MEFDANKYLDLYYSVLAESKKDKEAEFVYYIEMAEVLKLILTGGDYTFLSNRMNKNGFDSEDIRNHRFTTRISNTGHILFEVPEDLKKEILERNPIETILMRNAINRIRTIKEIKIKTNGSVGYYFGSPDGNYALALHIDEEYKGETMLFTDGDCSDNILYQMNDGLSSIRAITVKNASFTFLLYYCNGVLDEGEIRGIDSNGDTSLIVSEFDRVSNGINDSFYPVVDTYPKVYRYKRH